MSNDNDNEYIYDISDINYSKRSSPYLISTSDVNTDVDLSILKKPDANTWQDKQDKIKTAENYRTLGNESFKRGYLESAIEYYTKAINIYPDNHEFYTNRALCFKRQNKWDLVESDVRHALNLDEDSVKAHYYLGQALIQLGNPIEGLRKLKKAKCLSEHYHVPYIDDIDNEILRAKRDIWFSDDAKFTEVLNSFKDYITDLIDKEHAVGNLTEEGYTDRKDQLNIIMDRIIKSTDRKIPSYLSCKISMSLMRDPVISPSGITYERSLLEEHLKSNGEFDPVTREPCKLSDLIPNYYIKEAVESFLEEYVHLLFNTKLQESLGI